MSELKPQGLKKSQILLYGFFGMFLNTFYLMFLAYNRLFYLTNVLQLSTQISAVVNTLSVWGNVVTMLLAGAIIEKFTFKSGKFRTWAVIGGIVVGIIEARDGSIIDVVRRVEPQKPLHWIV